jgi:hypothetical protein
MVTIAPVNSFSEMHAKTFYVLASRATHRAVFFTDCKEAFKEAVLRPGERVAVWNYENGNGPNSRKTDAQVDDQARYGSAEPMWDYENGNGPDSQKIAAQVDDEERYGTAETRDDEAHDVSRW